MNRGVEVDISKKLDVARQSSAGKATDVFKDWILVKRLFLLTIFIWPSIFLIYYGFGLNTSSLDGSAYLNAIFSAASAIACYISERSEICICFNIFKTTCFENFGEICFRNFFHKFLFVLFFAEMCISKTNCRVFFGQNFGIPFVGPKTVRNVFSTFL